MSRINVLFVILLLTVTDHQLLICLCLLAGICRGFGEHREISGKHNGPNFTKLWVEMRRPCFLSVREVVNLVFNLPSGHWSWNVHASVVLDWTDCSQDSNQIKFTSFGHRPLYSATTIVFIRCMNMTYNLISVLYTNRFFSFLFGV